MSNTVGSFAATLDELRAAVGREAFVTEWVEMTQRRIDLFAEATGDYQWIHVDPERARRESAFGGSIAHGFLTLSLLGKFYAEHMTLPFTEMGINYGLNRVRFTHPVRAGSRVRGRFLLSRLEDIEGGLQLSFTVTLEIEGQARPACVAESVVRQYYKAGGEPAPQGRASA
jgi:acyl dehydratase